MNQESRRNYLRMCNKLSIVAAALVLLLSTPLAGFAIDTCTNVSVDTNNPLTITETHSGNFDRGYGGSSFDITVSNNSVSGLQSSSYSTLCGTNITLGTTSVQVVAALPAGLTAVSMSGSGWSCDVPTLTCTRNNDGLAAGESYPVITLNVNVAVDAPLAMSSNADLTGADVSHSIQSIVVGDFLLGRNDVVLTCSWLLASAADTACVLHLVRIGDSSYYDSLGEAYSALVTDVPAEIDLHEAVYDGASFDVDTVVHLNGGRTCDFNTISDYSGIIGPLAITKGTLIPDRIIIF